MRAEQLLTHRPAELIELAVHAQLHPLEQDVAHQRKPVRVQPGRSESHQRVARLDPASIDETRAVDDPDNEARKIVLAVAIETRHLRRLAAKQRAPVLCTPVGQPFDHRP